MVHVSCSFFHFFYNLGYWWPCMDVIVIRLFCSSKLLNVVLLATGASDPLLPPFGIRAAVLSSTSVVLTWSDSAVIRGQKIGENRFYTVRYNPKMSRKSKTFNTTNLSCQLDDLKPDTDYEFSVRIVKGKYQSAWSLSVFNKTRDIGGHFVYCLLARSYWSLKCLWIARDFEEYCK